MSDKNNEINIQNSLDEILYQSLRGEVKPALSLNQRILDEAKEKHMKKYNRHINWVKAAAFAAAIVLASSGTIYAAQYLFKGSLALGDKEISQDIEEIAVNGLTAEELDRPYRTIPEVEDVLGVKLLKSDKAAETEIPYLTIKEFDDDGTRICSVSGEWYYVNDMEADLAQDETGHIWKTVGDRPYEISYEAKMYAGSDSDTGLEDEYDGSAFVENYTTQNGLTAYVFTFGGEYNAYITDNNVIYTFMVSSSFEERAGLQELEQFLDTLNY